MSRRGWAVAGVLAAAALVQALVLWPASHPELDPDRAERVTLYSIDFREEGKRLPDTGEVLYGYPVLGKTEVTDIGERRQLLGALRSAIAEWGVDQHACFFPRHVLRVEHGGRTTDYIICFQCYNYQKWSDGKHVTSSTTGDSATVFNKLLEDAKVPVVPPGCP